MTLEGISLNNNNNIYICICIKYPIFVVAIYCFSLCRHEVAIAAAQAVNSFTSSVTQRNLCQSGPKSLVQEGSDTATRNHQPVQRCRQYGRSANGCKNTWQMQNIGLVGTL